MRRKIKRDEREEVNDAASAERVGGFFVYFLAGLVGQSFTYIVQFMILRENWIRKQRATEVSSRVFTMLAPILLI